jgi:hypothetical protein
MKNDLVASSQVQMAAEKTAEYQEIKFLVASPKVQRAAEEVVNYMQDDEFRHYCECLMTAGSDHTHIWLAVRVLRDWLEMPSLEDEVGQMREAKEYFRQHQADTAA